MKKRVLVGMLAALMLVAFVACDNQVPQIPSTNHSVSEIQYVSGPLSYTAGDAFDPSAYEIRLVYLDGMNPEVVNGRAYLTVDSMPEANVTENSRVPVKYNNEVVFYVDVYTADVVVDITNGITSVPNNITSQAAVSTEGLTATLVLGDGTTSTYDASTLITSYSNFKVTVTTDEGYPVTLVADGVEVDNWTVSKEPNVGEASKLIVEYTVGDEKPSASIATADVYYDDVVTVAVYTADANNNKIEQLNASDLEALTGTIPSSLSYEVGSAANNATFYYDNNGTALTGSISIPSGRDWIESVANPSLKANKTFTAGTGSITASDFEAVATKASGATDTTSATIAIVGYADCYSLANEEAGPVELALQVTYTSKEVSKSFIHKITVTVGADSSEE